jgi:SEC-C motif-containing protein
MKLSVNSPCPCRSGEKYKKCCQIYHKGAIAKDALFSEKSSFIKQDGKWLYESGEVLKNML